jgi:hypothetical protein
MSVLILSQQPARAPQSPAEARSVEQQLSLRDREGLLSSEVARMEAQRPVLARQVRDADASFKAPYEMQLAQLEVQLAGARAELEAVRAQLIQVPTAPPVEFFTTQPPPSPPSLIDRIDPNAVTAAFMLLVLGMIVPLSLGLIRRFSLRSSATPPTVAPEIVLARLDRIDQSLDAIAIEVERVAESQRFMARTLAETAAKTAQAGGIDEAKPLLALGAGPIEPIRVSERQAVKQSITPH